MSFSIAFFIINASLLHETKSYLIYKADKFKKKENDQIEGQMHITDFPEYLPSA